MNIGIHSISDVCAESIFAKRDVAESAPEKQVAKDVWNMANSEEYDILFQQGVAERREINIVIIEKPVKEVVKYFFDGMKTTLEVIEEMDESRDKEFKRVKKELKDANEELEDKDERLNELLRRLKEAEREIKRLKRYDSDRRERSISRSRSRERSRNRRR